MTATLFLLALTTAAILGGLLPLAVRESSRALHLLLCLAAGFFLGTVFLHLLPELSHIASGQTTVWTWVLVGLLGVLVLDLGIFGHQSHAAVGWATLLGLGVHAAMVGLGLGMLPEVSMAFAFGMFAHKFGETFSLVSALRLSVQRRSWLLGLLVLFALVTPLTMLLGNAIRDSVPESFHMVVSALAAGSFLYVAVGDILPEVFHDSRDRSYKIVLLLLGTAFAALASLGHDFLHHAGSTPETIVDHGDHVHVVPATSDALGDGPGRFVLGLFGEAWSALCAAAPFLLAGFFVAGLIKVWMPKRFLTRALGGDDFASIVRASLIGAPLPLCSCSVLPTAIGLRKSGASKSSTISFLVATPETGIDSIAISAALLDPFLTIARPIGAVLSAIAAGLAASIPGRRSPIAVVDAKVTPPESEVASDGRDCCAQDEAKAGADVLHAHSHEEHLHGEPASPASSAPDKLREAVRFGFGPLFEDIVPSLLVGIVLAALFSMILPADLLAGSVGRGFLGIAAAALLGLPIYVCASASTPVAAALLAKGLSPGAALVFLLVGPATNLASIFVLTKEFGRRVVAFYVAAVVIVAVLLGLLTNLVYRAWSLPEPTGAAHDHEPSILGIVAGTLLLAIALRAIVRRVSNS
ncbi:MAG: SO_0444 family Cu/Zn efflux transporter [Planctomycetes bacterium]|nr:SO_0444 family Cu/Zn efflux transporter [Planctomycetota bacterium]